MPRVSMRTHRGPRLLRHWRLEQEPRCSQKDLARRIGKTEGMIRKYEARGVALQIPDCIALSGITGIPLADLLTREQLRLVREASDLLGKDAA